MLYAIRGLYSWLTTDNFLQEKNIEEATILAYNFEHAARLQLLAMAAGEIKELEHTPAQDAHDFMLKDSIIDAVFLYQARLRISSGDKDALD